MAVVYVQCELTTLNIAQNQVASPTLDTAFFEESNEFWAPESDTSKLYEQLAKRKYREIPRSAIQ